MRKRVFTIAALALCIVATAGSAYGQGQTLAANIPFEFVAGSQTLPAGEYQIESELLGDGHVQLIRSVDGRASTMVFTMAVLDPKGRQVEPKLVFNKYGHTYFLSQIWGEGDQGREVPKSRREKELARNEARTEVAVLVHSSPVRP